jgi:hypothetical protein
MMVQMPFPQSGRYRRAFRELVYGALLHERADATL